jgi:two-component system invasion response regulator UvrY
MRILIADDHAVVRRGIRGILAEHFSKATFAEAQDAREALEEISKHDWSLVILDISMPGRSGMDVLGELKRMRPRVPVLVLSVHPEEQFARRALKAGASGYLTKESLPEELVKAVRKVLSGSRYVSASLAEKLVWELDREVDKPLHDVLSDREFQILCLLASGKTVKEIGEELALSVKTVSTYRTRIIEKTGLRNNAEMIRYAIQNKLVEQ